MTLKLKPREKLLAANAIGNVKLALTSEEYGEAVDYLIEAESAIFDLRASLSGKLPDVDREHKELLVKSLVGGKDKHQASA